MATPGEHQTIRGIEVMTVESHGACLTCPFRPSLNNLSCDDVECNLVIWLTPLDYIAHRLAGETT